MDHAQSLPIPVSVEVQPLVLEHFDNHTACEPDGMKEANLFEKQPRILRDLHR